jgi:hypothetical protein
MRLYRTMGNPQLPGRLFIFKTFYLAKSVHLLLLTGK